MGKTPGLIAVALAVTAAAVLGVTLVRRAADDRVGEDSGPCRGTVGIEVTGLSRAWRSRLGLPDEVLGAVVTEVLPRSPAATAGLRVGDVISAVGATPVTDACASGFWSGRGCEPIDLVLHRSSGPVRLSVAPAPEALLYRQACRSGVPSACYRLARISWSGSGASPDEERPLELFEDACRRGSGAACAALGEVLGPDAARGQEALSLLERACGLQDARGCLLLASAFAMGTLASRDDARAAPLYEKSCDLGSALGCYNAGLMFNEGRGVPMDHRRAFRAYAEGCSMGSTTACTDEGFMREWGRGVEQDQALAADRYRRACQDTACQSANLLGCVNLGRAHRDGIGVARDPARAAEIFRGACDRAPAPDDVAPARQRARACSLLGALYLVGQGVDTDPVQGLALSKRGCNEGDDFGCYNAGVVFARGLGVGPDDDMAAGFFRRACEGGDEEACTYVLRKLPSLVGVGEVRAGDRPR